MAIKHVDPISRIEGHLGVRLTETAGVVTEADVHGNLWRGFENFLIGRNPNDAITFTQRICGVCPVPHGMTAAYAVDAVYGYSDGFQTFATGLPALNADGVTIDPVNTKAGVPVKALHLRNVVLSAEFLMSHITHLYHLAAPSYIQGPNMPPWTPYFADSYYHPLLLSGGDALPSSTEGFSDNLWSAVIKQYVKALRIRRLTFEAGALFAGRMPMTSALVAGGVLNDKSESLTVKCNKFRQMMQEVGSFIVKEFVPTFLALGALYPNYDNLDNATTLHSAHNPLWEIAHADNVGATPDASNTGYGAGVGNFLSWGGFPQVDGTLGTARGYKIGAGAVQPISKADVYSHLREHIKHSRYEGSVTALNADGTPVITATNVTDPSTEVRTVPKRDDDAKYSWMKAPRWNGAPMEVGPFARMVVGGLYPVDGTALAAHPNLGPVYGLYTKTVGANTGLDPAMIEPDLAVALVREGLAEVNVNGTVYDAAAITGAPNATLLAVYTDPDAVIMGAVRNWVILLKGGLSNMDRLRGRALESLITVTKMIGMFTKGATGGAPISWPAGGGWVGALATATGPTYNKISAPTGLVSGFGATEAPRGALMHFCTTNKGKIVAYQCVVPTTWNASPKDASDVRGPMEQAMIGIPYSTAGASFETVAGATQATGGGVEALRVAQSFDPCIACAVH